MPKEIPFQTKSEMSEIALKQIEAAVNQGVPQGPVLADAAYGIDSRLRKRVAELGLAYVVGVQSTMSVWKLDKRRYPTNVLKHMEPIR